MNSVLRNLAVWFVLGSVLIYVFNNIENSGVREQISYSQFKEEVLSDRVAKVVYKGDQMTITGERLDGSKFETTHPIFKKDEVVDNAIQDNGIIAVYEKIEQPSILSQLLVGAFPIILLLGIFFFFIFYRDPANVSVTSLKTPLKPKSYGFVVFLIAPEYPEHIFIFIFIFIV